MEGNRRRILCVPPLANFHVIPADVACVHIGLHLDSCKQLQEQLWIVVGNGRQVRSDGVLFVLNVPLPHRSIPWSIVPNGLQLLPSAVQGSFYPVHSAISAEVYWKTSRNRKIHCCRNER